MSKTQHEYMRRLELAIEKGIMDRAFCAFVNVGHDSRCGIYSGRFCDCDPEITFYASGELFGVQKDGTVRLFAKN